MSLKGDDDINNNNNDIAVFDDVSSILEDDDDYQSSRGDGVSDTFTSSTHHTQSSSYAESLLHAAVKSVLDDIDTSTSMISDDDDDNESDEDVDNDTMDDEKEEDNDQTGTSTTSPPKTTTQQQRKDVWNSKATSSPHGRKQRQQDNDQNSLHGLESLKHETLPPLPHVDDRKRFIGCLAAILANSYDYDVITWHENESSSSHNDGTNSSIHTTTTTTTTFDDWDDDMDEEFEEEQRPLSSASSWEASSAAARGGGGGDESSSRSTHDGDGVYSAPTKEFQEEATAAAPAFAGDDDTVMTEMSTTTTTPTTNNHNKPSLSRQATEMLLWHNKRKMDAISKLKLSQSRHRKRRYELLCDFLFMAADRLLLDRAQSKAFLPMLAHLLLPETKRKRRKQQRKRQQQQKQSNNKNKRSDDDDDDDDNDDDDDPIAKLWKQQVPNNNNNNNNSSSQNNNSCSFFQQEKMAILEALDPEDVLRPFLESLTCPQAGFQCLSLLLLQHLLKTEQGYDARIRHVMKTLGLVLFIYEMEEEEEEPRTNDYDGDSNSNKTKITSFWNRKTMMERASRKFESLEHVLATRILELSTTEQELLQKQKEDPPRKGKQGIKSRFVLGNNDKQQQQQQQRYHVSREQVIRGLKIGSAGIVAGTLFAVTGGLAAPGLAAGIGALVGSTAVAGAAVAALTSTAAVTTIFGVGGAGLAAYKMQRRTKGLTEFEFQKESGLVRNIQEGHAENAPMEAELFTTICISGWLRDYSDFQRPWGTTPWNPPITNRTELLERFYAVHKPDHILKSPRIMYKWRGEEEDLWKILRAKYGTDPDHLFPLEDGPRYRGTISVDHKEMLDKMFIELGYVRRRSSSSSKRNNSQQQAPPSPFDLIRSGGWRKQWRQSRANRNETEQQQRHDDDDDNFALLDEEMDTPFDRHGGIIMNAPNPSAVGPNETSNSTHGGGVLDSEQQQTDGKQQKDNGDLPSHVSTVWDYQATYGGELYTIRWEESILMELNNSVEDLAIDIVSQGAQHFLKTTVLATIVSAMVFPSALLKAANMIDGTWTLAIERSDQAGRELARSLLFSRAGHRPVNLIGYSMGARMIYSCLKELVRYQEKWEEEREQRATSDGNNKTTDAGATAATNNKKNKRGNSKKERRAEEFSQMREPASIVEDVILIGMPNHLSLRSWRACRQVIGGRFVNVYSRRDMILTLMFQYKRMSGGFKPVCGTCAVDVPGVENVDVSDIITGHQQYCHRVGTILERVRQGQPVRGPTDHKVVLADDAGKDEQQQRQFQEDTE